MSRMASEPAPATTPVLVWTMRSSTGLRWYGVSRTVAFYRLSEHGWWAMPRTSGTDDMLVRLAAECEQDGYALVAGPVEFGIDQRLVDRMGKDGVLSREDDFALRTAFEMAAGR